MGHAAASIRSSVVVVREPAGTTIWLRDGAPSGSKCCAANRAISPPKRQSMQVNQPTYFERQEFFVILTDAGPRRRIGKQMSTY